MQNEDAVEGVRTGRGMPLGRAGILFLFGCLHVRGFRDLWGECAKSLLMLVYFRVQV
jgi:hypothetical protein